MDLLRYTFFQHALLGSLLASIACGIIGTYIVTRRLVFISGGITHASFGGIGLGLFAGISPILSAAVFSVLSAFGVEWLSRRKDMREDSAIAVFWTLGMALGIMFSFLSPGFAPDLSAYLFVGSDHQSGGLVDAGHIGSDINRILLSVYPSYRIYCIRPRVCPFAKDSGRDIRISADDVYCVDHRRLSAYGRHRSRNIATHHSANDGQPLYLQFQENHLAVHRYRFSGMSGWSVYFLPLESPFGRFDYILLYSDLCHLQDRKELLQETVIITD